MNSQKVQAEIWALENV